jgi:hypothetical protein
LVLSLAGLLVIAGCGRNDPAAAWRDLHLTDLEAQSVEPLTEPGLRAVVFVFVSNDCPISNRYAPELRRLGDEFEGRGVRFWMVHPNGDETPESIRAHDREFQLPGRALRDVDLKLVERTGVTVTPEAAVVLPSGVQVYRGRIDDRFVALGQERVVVTTRDLAEVLGAITSGRPVSPTNTVAVGCHISGATLR